jgi:dihydrofolate reductase
MRRIILYIATSLDNFIARPDGSIDWLEQTTMNKNEDFGYQRFYDSVDTTIMGARTYEQICNFDVPFPYPDKRNMVITTRNDLEKVHESVEFLQTDLNTQMKKLKQVEGKNIWLIGGSQINTYMLKQRLLDRIIMTKIPVFIGAGIPLFQPVKDEFHAVLDESKNYGNNIMQLTYSLLL